MMVKSIPLMIITLVKKSSEGESFFLNIAIMEKQVPRPTRYMNPK